MANCVGRPFPSKLKIGSSVQVGSRNGSASVVAVGVAQMPSETKKQKPLRTGRGLSSAMIAG
eukprot:6202364-Pleurochrysis_carterae.AAC.1